MKLGKRNMEMAGSLTPELEGALRTQTHSREAGFGQTNRAFARKKTARETKGQEEEKRGGDHTERGDNTERSGQ